MNEKKLVRSRDDRMVFGVAAGLAHYLKMDPVIIRLLFVLLTLAGGHGILIYLVLAILMPDQTVPSAKPSSLDEEEIVIKGA